MTGYGSHDPKMGYCVGICQPHGPCAGACLLVGVDDGALIRIELDKRGEKGGRTDNNDAI